MKWFPRRLSAVNAAIAVIMAAILLPELLVLWWAVEPPPFDEPTNVRLAGPARLQVTDSVRIQRNVCVRREGVAFFRVVRWHARTGDIFTSMGVQSVTPAVGCQTAIVLYPIPDDLPPGFYRVHTDWSVTLNPLRRVAISGGDVEVEIVP